MKLIALLLAGTAGLGSSYALANDGDGHHGHDQKAANGPARRLPSSAPRPGRRSTR